MRAKEEDRYPEIHKEKIDEVSGCCGAPLIEDNNICSKCYEACDVMTADEYQLEESDRILIEQEAEKRMTEIERCNEILSDM